MFEYYRYFTDEEFYSIVIYLRLHGMPVEKSGTTSAGSMPLPSLQDGPFHPELPRLHLLSTP